MRIVGGRLGGRRLAAPRGHATRPTSERVREGIASALDARDRIRDAIVLDLFAGTGALAFEAISRGAARAVLVDRDAKLLRAIREGAHDLGVTDAITTLALDLESPPSSWIRRLPDERFDLVFLDPPYANIALVTGALAGLAECGKLSPNAAVIVEHARRAPPVLPAGFSELATYRYGDTAVVLASAPDEENGERT